MGKRIRIGFIGTGGIAHWHGSQLKALPDAEIVAIADVSEPNRTKFVSEFGLDQCAQYAEYKDMLERTELDAVVICSPHTLHYEQAMDVLNKGLHVLVEKPMACTSQETKEMIALAERQGKVLQVSYQRHFQPEFLFIKKALEDGVIGRLTSVTVTLCQDWKQLSTGTWRQNPQLSGGGMLMDSGSHIIDVLLWTTGMTPQNVKVQMQSHGAPVELDSMTAIEFAEGAVAGVNVVGYAPCFFEQYIYCGEEGGIFFTDGKIGIRRRGQETVYPEMPPQTTNQDKSFVDAILGRHEVLVPGSFAQKVVRLTESIYKAAGYSPHS